MRFHACILTLVYIGYSYPVSSSDELGQKCVQLAEIERRKLNIIFCITLHSKTALLAFVGIFLQCVVLTFITD